MTPDNIEIAKIISDYSEIIENTDDISSRVILFRRMCEYLIKNRDVVMKNQDLKNLIRDEFVDFEYFDNISFESEYIQIFNEKMPLYF